MHSLIKNRCETHFHLVRVVYVHSLEITLLNCFYFYTTLEYKIALNKILN